jgi:hypothetical protein
VVVIVWYFDLQLPVQSMHITTKVVSSNPVHGFNVLYETCIGQLQFGWLVYWIIVFNVTINYISVISWWSVLLVEETGVPREVKHYNPINQPTKLKLSNTSFIENIKGEMINLKYL